jgi:type III secretion protein J
LLIALLFIVAGCAPSPVAVSLSDEDATRVVASLARAGIPATKKLDASSEGHFAVTVSPADATSALQVMSDDDLPPRVTPSLDSVAGSSLVPSPRVEHARMLAAQASELERSLRAVDGVVSARVHIAAPPPASLGVSFDAPNAHATNASASVLIKFRGEQPPLPIVDVQHLVAGAIHGLSPDAVSVITVRATQAPVSAGWANIGPVVVSRGSLPTARAVLTSLLIACVLLAIALAWTRLRPARSSPTKPS